MTTEQNMLDALIQHQVYGYRASTAVVNELNGLFTKAMNQTATKLRELLDELTDAERDALLSGRYTTDTLKEIKATFDELHSAVAVTVPETFTVSAIALATYEASYISKLYGEEIELNGSKVVAGIKKKPVMGGMLFDDVWKNLAESTRNKALYAVRQGIEQGNTTAQIVAELRGKRARMPNGSYEYVGGIVDEVRRNGIEANVRTIRSHVSQVAYESTFSALGFDFVKDIATLDGRTTSTCRAIDGRVQKISENMQRPPYHMRCRTIQIGVDKDGNLSGKRPFVADTRSVKNIPKDERGDIIGQVNANTTYPQWFKNQSAAFQKEVLGPTKYELYKKGGYSFDRFVDELGKPYTIAELRSLDEKTFKELGL